MKRALRFFLLFFSIATNMNSLRSQWIQTTGPYSGYVYSIVVFDTILIVGTYDGVFLSTNNGARWTKANTGLTDTNVRTIIRSGTNLFAGTDAGVFLSTNIGTSWSNRSTGLTFNEVSAIAVSGRNLFAGISYGGVYCSTDSGTSWNQVDSGLTNTNVIALAVSDTNIFAGTGNYGGVFRYTNYGANWKAINTGLTNTLVGALAVSGTNLYVGTNGGIFRSTNNGTNWSLSGLANTSVSFLSVMDTNVFAGTSDGRIFLSTDKGSSWTEINNTGSSSSVTSMAVNGANLYAATYDGLFQSSNNGTSWNVVNLGMPNQPIGGLAVSPNGTGGTNIFAVTGSYSGVFRSTNNGTSWFAASSGLPVTLIGALGVDGANLYASTYNLGVFSSTNNGANWNAANSGLPGFSTFAVSDTNLFAGTGNGVFLSTNDGTSWFAASTDLTNANVTSLAISGPNLLAGTYNGGVYRSTDNGSNWAAVNSGFPSYSATTYYDIQTLVVSGPSLFAGIMYTGVYRSTNNGTSWSVVDSSVTCTYINGLTAYGTNLFAGMGGGVSVSTDNGTSWIAANAGLPPAYVNALAISGTDLFISTAGEGVWRRPISEMIASIPPNIILSEPSLAFGSVQNGSTKTDTLIVTNNSTVPLIIDSVFTGTKWFSTVSRHDTVTKADAIRLLVSFNPDSEKAYSDKLYIVSNSITPLAEVALNGNGTITAVLQNTSILPNSYGLSQNYPNPFNPTTIINYQLPANSSVSLKVYDLLGREVATLINRRQNAGYYNATFNGTNLPSGVYFYRLQTETYSSTKKLLLLK